MSLRHAFHLLLVLTLTACGGGGSDAVPGSGAPPASAAGTVLAAGKVVNELGIPLAGATVTVLSPGGTSTDITAAPVTTDSQGAFSLTLGTATPAMLRVDKAGYMRMLRAAGSAALNSSFAARIDLQPVGATVLFDSAQAAVLRVPGSPARVELAAAALVRVDGSPISGQARVDLTPIDPSRNIRLMPGVMVDSASGTPIESLGAMAINFSDSTGAVLNLAPGQTATLRIPATPAAGTTPPATYPLYYLNETTGLWVQEGTAVLKTDAATGALYYEGTVSHFSFWNADQVVSTAFVDISQTAAGTCSYGDGVAVSQSGVNYNGSDTVLPSSGSPLKVRASSTAKVILHKRGEIMDSVEVATPAPGLTVRLPRCLTEPARVTVSGKVIVASGTLAGYQVQLGGSDYLFQTVAIGADGSYSTEVYGGRGPISARLVGAEDRRDLPTTAVTGTVTNTNLTLPLLTVNDARVEMNGCVTGWASYRQDRIQLGLSRDGIALAQPVSLNQSNNTFSFLVPVNSQVQLLLTPPDASLLERRVTVTAAITPFTLPDCLALPKGPIPSSVASGTGLARQFDASASIAGDAAIASYQWTFGDGGTASGAMVSHNFAATGDYLVSLTLTDASGQTSTVRSLVAVTAPGNLSSLTPASSFDAGADHACAIRNGSPWCWGSNLQQQIGRLRVQTVEGDNIVVTGIPASNVGLAVDSSITNATAVSAGEQFSCVLLATGGVKCWGGRQYGGLGDGTSSGSAVPVTVSGIATAKAISVGGFHGCALLADGTVRCWGDGTAGQMGNGASVSSTVPVQVSGITTAVAISAGRAYTCALLADTTLRCWGTNSFGQLGDNSTVSSAVPVAVGGITGAFAISAGTDHSCAIVGAGEIKCWGYRGFSQGARLGDGSPAGGIQLTPVTVSGISNAVAVSAGNSHSCALLADATVWCWGFGSSSELGTTLASPYLAFVPQKASLLGPTAAISAGSSFNCAVLVAGTLQCFGSNDATQLGAGQGQVIDLGFGGTQTTGLLESATPLTVLFP